jgi:hypothetical protein
VSSLAETLLNLPHPRWFSQAMNPPELPAVPSPTAGDIARTIWRRVLDEDITPVFTAATGEEAMAELKRRCPSYIRRLITLSEVLGRPDTGEMTNRIERAGESYGLPDADVVGRSLRNAHRALQVWDRIGEREDVWQRFGVPLQHGFGLLLIHGLCMDAMIATAEGDLQPSPIGHGLILSGVADAAKLAFTTLRGVEITLEWENEESVLAFVADPESAELASEAEAFEADVGRRVDVSSATR